jgi:hypothetical protein
MTPQAQDFRTLPGGVASASSPAEFARQVTGTLTTRLVMTPISKQDRAIGVVVSAAREIAASGRSVILVDASLHGDEIAFSLDMTGAPGLVDIISGEATFEGTVRCDSESALQLISGAQGQASDQAVSTDRLGSVMYALEVAYDHVVIFAESEQAVSFIEIRGKAKPALTLIGNPAMSNEDALWHADRLLGDAASVSRVHMLADSEGGKS